MMWTGLLELANCTLSGISPQETDTLSLLLVTELPRHPPYISLDAAQPNATGHMRTILRTPIRG
jgi:hypothetical protein